MKYKLLIIACTLLLTFQSCKDSNNNVATTGEIELISPKQVYDAVHNQDSLQLVDVRTAEEFVVSHLKGAQNICVTNDNFDKKVKTLDKTKPVYLYCKSGKKSSRAAKKLKEMGFTKVYDMEGGITSWKEENLETEN